MTCSSKDMGHRFTEDDEGKTVVDTDGKEIGIIVDVEDSTAYVLPDPGITKRIFASLGWSDKVEDTYPLQEGAVEAITDNEVRLVPSPRYGGEVNESTDEAEGEDEATTTERVTAGSEAEFPPEEEDEATTNPASEPVVESPAEPSSLDSDPSEQPNHRHQQRRSQGLKENSQFFGFLKTTLSLFREADDPDTFAERLSEGNIDRALQQTDMTEEDLVEHIEEIENDGEEALEDPDVREVVTQYGDEEK